MTGFLLFLGSFFALYGWGRALGDSFLTHQTLNIGRYLLLGIFVTIFLGQIIHLFFALNERVSIIWLSSGVLILLYKLYVTKNIVHNFNKPAAFLSLLTLFILIGLATKGITNYDSGLYHIQTIKWLQAEPIVLGIVNLHHRLAFNQTYFIFSSMVSPFPYPIAIQTVTNTIISFSIVASLYTNNNWRKLYNAEAGSSSIFSLATLILILVIIQKQITSLSPDFMLNAIMIISFIFYMLYFLDETENDQTANIGILILLLALIPTIKLSGLVFSLVATSIILFKAYHDKRVKNLKLILPLTLSIILILIYIFRHTLFSGCLLYPLPSSCLPLEWTTPQHAVKHVENTITSWARWPGHPNHEVLNTYDWLLPWLRRFFTNKLVIQLLIFSAVSLYFIKGKISKPIQNNSLYILAPVILGIFVWAYKAPDIRFLTSYIMILIIWFFTVFIYSIREYKAEIRKKYTYILLSIFIIPNLSILGNIEKWYQFSPIPTPNMKTMETISGTQVLIPISTDQCWDAPLPCTPQTEFRNKLTFKKKVLWYIATYSNK